MIIKGLVDEDFINYKQPCMYICTSTCTFKCDVENGGDYCQNGSLPYTENRDFDDDLIIKRYVNNNITKAICFSGLEPIDQIDELLVFIDKLRNQYHCDDTVIIYSGYNEDEINDSVQKLSQFSNIIIKFGRYVPSQRSHKDPVLGVRLASKNQYAVKIS